MHHRLQFGMRENPASDRRHGLRQAVLRNANKNHVNDQGVRVSGLTPAARGEERLRKLSRTQKSESHLTKRIPPLFNVVMRTNGMAYNPAPMFTDGIA